MKTLRITAFALVLAATFGASHAHASGPMWIGPYAGVTMPVGDFANRASTGFDLGVSAETKLQSLWSMGGEFGWYTMGGNDDLEKKLSAQFGATTDVKTRIYPLIVFGKLEFSSEGIQPYAKLGVGGYFANTKYEYAGRESNHSDSVFGVMFGGGFTRELNQSLRWGGEVDYHWLGTKNSASQMVEVRAQLQFRAGK